ncbi:hypothetical protein FKM82_014235 [Ascaphus truei]|uniref:uncharacterized protein LOC142496677 isoform X2 n=1 Tax=Ascaphus truei TaxID=8439 RepID=UPI003F5A30D0
MSLTMLAGDISATRQIPELQVPNPSDSASGSSSCYTPTHRRRRFKMRRPKSSRSRETGESLSCARNPDYLQLPSIEITPSSDEDSAQSNSSTPSTSPRRKGLRLKHWGSKQVTDGTEVELQVHSESRVKEPAWPCT